MVQRVVVIRLVRDTKSIIASVRRRLRFTSDADVYSAAQFITFNDVMRLVSK